MKFDRKKINELRETKGLSQSEFAREIGVSRQMVNNWEVGNNEPLIKSLIVVCKKFGINIEYFFTKS